MDGLEGEISGALAMGRRNAELIALARKHCSHIRVEHSPLAGVSMLEQETGLPISMREFRCGHAARAGGAAANLAFLAVRFYESNCRECPQREVVGVPNLATLADGIIEERQADEQRKASRHKDEESARERRRQRRADAVKHEKQSTRDLVARINRLDSNEEPLGVGDELVALVRGAPQLVTEAAGDVLVEAAATTGSEPVLDAVRCAAESSRISKERALRVASDVLSTRYSANAAHILLEFSDQVTLVGALSGHSNLSNHHLLLDQSLHGEAKSGLGSVCRPVRNEPLVDVTTGVFSPLKLRAGSRQGSRERERPLVANDMCHRRSNRMSLLAEAN